jgi:hypothetical protein
MDIITIRESNLLFRLIIEKMDIRTVEYAMVTKTLCIYSLSIIGNTNTNANIASKSKIPLSIPKTFLLIDSIFY